MTDMVQQISDMIEPYVDRHLWELDDLSQRIVRLFETEIERLRTERTEAEADLNAWRARAELAAYDPVLTISENEYLTASDGIIVYRGPGVLYEKVDGEATA